MPEISETNAPHWHRADRTKTCVRCGEMKPVSEFYGYGYTTKQGKRSIRYESRCKPCARARRTDAYHADPEGENAKAQAWREKNRNHLRAYAAEKRKDPHHKAIKAKAQRMRKARIRAGSDHQSEAIRAIYAEAMRMEQIIAPCPVWRLPELGGKIHVDHIMPLSKGGAHVADNLQLLPAGINMRKHASCPR